MYPRGSLIDAVGMSDIHRKRRPRVEDYRNVCIEQKLGQALIYLFPEVPQAELHEANARIPPFGASVVSHFHDRVCR